MLLSKHFPAALVLAASAWSASAYAATSFTDVTAAVGIDTYADQSWGSPLWGDITGDGKLDIVVPNHTAAPRFWINDGKGFFTLKKVTDIGVITPEGDTLDWHGFELVDINNDGRIDLHITEGAKMGAATKTDLVYFGNATGTFTYGLPPLSAFNVPGRGRSAAWFDYDKDGYLDLFQKNYESSNIIYRNQAGLNLVAATGAAPVFEALQKGSILSLMDYNLDGRTDIMVTGMGSVGTDAFRDTLLRQEADGTFTDVTTASLIVTESGSRGIAWGDFDNDGDPDLMLARGFDDTGRQTTATENIADRLFRNNGDGTFTDVTLYAGLSMAQNNSWCVLWGDLDNDGWLDLVIPQMGDLNGVGNGNLVYRNNGNGTFTEVGEAWGLANRNDNIAYRHMGGALADYDGDGFLDVLLKSGVGRQTGVTQLFRNNRNANRFLGIKLVGTDSNRQGIGATVEVSAGTRTQKQQYYGGGGGELYSQSATPLHFGMGPITTATVTVRWPSGKTQILADQPTNQMLTITEPTDRFFVTSYAVAKSPTSSGYVMTVVANGCANVNSVELEANTVAMVAGFTVVDATTLTVNFAVAPSKTLDAPLDVIFVLKDGSRVTVSDGLAMPAKTYAVELAAGVIGYEDLVYGQTPDGESLRINIYRPEQATGPLPTILWIHGGAFKGGSRRGVMQRILTMTTQGYAVVSMDHRLAPTYIFDAPVEDAKAVVRYLRANAATYGLDADNIGVAGGSSGGFLAAFLGTSGGVSGFDDDHGNQLYSSRVKAVCVLYGGTDLVTLAQIRGLDSTSNEAALLGVAPLDNVDLAMYASPSTYVSSDDPPFLLLYGEFDTTAPAQQGQLLHDLLTTVGVDAALQILPYTHDFPTNTPQMDADIYAFFDRHLKPPVQPLAISGVSTARLVPGTTATVTVTGTSFAATDTFVIGPSAMGVRITSTSFVDKNSWQLTLALSATAKVGKRDLTVKNLAGTAVKASQLFSVEVDAPPPSTTPLSLVALSTNKVEQGKTVSVNLSGTGLTSGLKVSFAPSALGVRVDGSIVVAADGTSAVLSITATSTATVGLRDVVVTLANGSRATLAKALEVTAPPVVVVPPTLTGLSPSSVEQGQSVTMTLTGTGLAQGVTVSFAPSALGLRVDGPITASADGKTATLTVVATATATVGGRDLVVTGADGSSVTLGAAVSVTAPVPPPVLAPELLTLNSLSVNTIKVNQTITTRLNGSGFVSGTTIGIGPSAFGLRVSAQTLIDSRTIEVTLVTTATAKVGGRDFTLTNPDGSTFALAAAIAVVAP